MRKSKGGDKPKPYKRGKNVPKGPKAPSKKRQTQFAAAGGAGSSVPRARKNSKVKSGSVGKYYSPKGDWEIFSGGSSRRTRKASSPSSAGEQKPYAGWSKARKKR